MPRSWPVWVRERSGYASCSHFYNQSACADRFECLAADFRAPPPQAPAIVTPVFNWTGFYIGINGGYGWGTSVELGTRSNGGLIGATLGHGGRWAPVVLGLEGDIAWAHPRQLHQCGLSVGCGPQQLAATVRGRLGYSIDRIAV